jgi:hypothetical protein
MAIRQCAKCFEVPCECGFIYKDWDNTRFARAIATMLKYKSHDATYHILTMAAEVHHNLVAKYTWTENEGCAEFKCRHNIYELTVLDMNGWYQWDIVLDGYFIIGSRNEQSEIAELNEAKRRCEEAMDILEFSGKH